MRILIVVRSAQIRAAVTRTCEGLGHACIGARDGESAWVRIRDDPVDVVIAERGTDGSGALELCRLVRGHSAGTRVYFLLVADGDLRTLIPRAKTSGVDDFLSVPLDPDEIALRLQLASRSLDPTVASSAGAGTGAHPERAPAERRRGTRDRARASRLIGSSEAMQRIRERIRLAASSPVPVLLHGESGTGKELVAQAIHRESPRRDGPLIAVNCGAIPDSLLESELFGHVKGAFTGAIRDKSGYFEMANGGTLFLDEIGDISTLLQVKLLRSIEEQEIRRVGGERSIPVDVRIITATNRELDRLVEDGRFRQDLFYRIRVFQIDLPPLRERPEDIPTLVRHFVRVLSRERGKGVRSVREEAMHALLRHTWPGNVRELRNAIEHAFVTVADSEIRPEDLPPELAAGVAADPLRTETSRALRESGGHRGRAAESLGISRVALWKRIRRYSLEKEFPPRTGKGSRRRE